MTAWLSHLWSAVWPNLIADVVWVPVVGASHWALRRHLDRVHRDLKRGGQE